VAPLASPSAGTSGDWEPVFFRGFLSAVILIVLVAAFLVVILVLLLVIFRLWRRSQMDDRWGD
jgi:hypothetical protein